METPSRTPSAPLVSIAICTYNGERFLRKQLDSLIAQDYRPLEMIIVDDGSSDGTRAIIQEYAGRHNFIHFHQNEQNLGYVKNFEKALSLCTGDYIALCDQDDIWLPRKISTQMQEIGDSSLTYSDLSYIDEDGRPIDMPPRKTNRLSGRCPLALLFGTCVTGHLALLKREVLEKALPFPKGIRAHDHWIPFIAAALNGIKPTNHVLSLYRTHGQNASMKQRQKKTKTPLRRIKERQKIFTRKLHDRIQFMQAAQICGLLSSNEISLLDEILRELGKLDTCFINTSLKELLTKQSNPLLSMYLEKQKMAKRLSRGKLYYQLTLYMKKP